jgi:sugar phosphate isomerase/epimerase
MTLKFACADFTFPLLAHDHALALIGMMGFQGVDIGLFEGRSHLMPSDQFADIRASAGRLRGRLRELGLVPADVFLQASPDFHAWPVNHPDPARRQHARSLFEKTLAYAAELGCGHVTTLPGVTFADEARGDSLKRAAQELAWRVDRASAAGITFAVEAHVGSIVPTPGQALELVAMTPGLTLTLDYTHFTRAGIPDSEVEPMIAHASHFHARAACKGRLQTLLPANTIDYGRVLQKMKETGYQGWVGVEYVWIDWEHCNECDNVSETVRMRSLLLEHAARLRGS